jgi:hypothetical protein
VAVAAFWFGVYRQRQRSRPKKPGFFAKAFGLWGRLNEVLRNQTELDEYLDNSMSEEVIGRHYERQIGYLFEMDGYDVKYNGAEKGYADLGRDLIAQAGKEVLIIQTKCWKAKSLIHEKHIFQLFGSVEYYKRGWWSKDKDVKAIFFSKSDYSDGAKKAAKVLGVDIRMAELDKGYPMIKCKVDSNGERIYLLPSDEHYDKVKIRPGKDEFYVRTVKEAVSRGFRRRTSYRGVS